MKIHDLNSFFGEEVTVWIQSGRGLSGILKRSPQSDNVVSLLPSEYWTPKYYKESIIDIAFIEAISLLVRFEDRKE